MAEKVYKKDPECVARMEKRALLDALEHLVVASRELCRAERLTDSLLHHDIKHARQEIQAFIRDIEKSGKVTPNEIMDHRKRVASWL